MEDDLSGINILDPDHFEFETKVEVGRGGCAKTFKVDYLGEKRALKKPNGKTKLCTKEIAILNNIQHENIVRLFGIVHYEEKKCIVMELAENGSLYDYLYAREKRPFILTDSHKRQWISEVACGLKYLHHGLSKPVVHGDVKSPNVLIFHCQGDQKIAKLADFGLSEELEMTAEGGDQGFSCRWAAPETVKATLKSTKSDVWSFGAAVLEIWMEHLPYSFIGGHSREVESRIILGVGRGDLTPYRPESDKLPEMYHTLLMNCFIMEHKKRWNFQKICDFLLNENRNEENLQSVVANSSLVSPSTEKLPSLDAGEAASERYVLAVTRFEKILESDSDLFRSVKNLFRDKIPRGELERIKSPIALIDKLEKLDLLSYTNLSLVQKRLRFLDGNGALLANYFAEDEVGEECEEFVPKGATCEPCGNGGGIDHQIGANDERRFHKASSFSAETNLAQDEFGRLSVEPLNGGSRVLVSPRLSLPAVPKCVRSPSADHRFHSIGEIISEVGVERAFELVVNRVLAENFMLLARNLLGSKYRAYVNELRCQKQRDRTLEMLELWLGQERSCGREPGLRELATALRQSRLERTAAEVEKLERRPQ